MLFFIFLKSWYKTCLSPICLYLLHYLATYDVRSEAISIIQSKSVQNWHFKKNLFTNEKYRAHAWTRNFFSKKNCLKTCCIMLKCRNGGKRLSLRCHTWTCISKLSAVKSKWTLCQNIAYISVQRKQSKMIDVVHFRGHFMPVSYIVLCSNEKPGTLLMKG